MAKKVERIENGNTYYVYPKDTPVIIDGLIVSITDVYLCPKGEVYYLSTIIGYLIPKAGGDIVVFYTSLRIDPLRKMVLTIKVE